jgi:ribokinase
MNTIYVIGSSNTDMVVKCSHLPKPGETVLGGQFIQVHGGKGANQAVAAARLGGKVVFLCRVGDDSFGQQSLDAYQKEGIDISHIIIDSSGASGVALILVNEEGENSIAVASGVNANVGPGDVEILNELLKPGDIVLMQLEIPIKTVLRAAEIGYKKDVTVILDPAPAPRGGLPETLYPLLHYILPNECEAAALLGKESACSAMAEALQKKGVRHAIVTAGGEGAVLASELGLFEFPAHRVTAVDTTAAGDAFAGALAVALAEGYKTREAIAFAQAAASISVTRMGAQPSLSTREEVDEIVVHEEFME